MKKSRNILENWLNIWYYLLAIDHKKRIWGMCFLLLYNPDSIPCLIAEARLF